MATVALRRSRRRTLQRLEELDERVLLVRRQGRLLAEVRGPEVVAFVDDEIAALADREEVVDEPVRDDAKIFLDFQLLRRTIHEREQLLQVRLPLRAAQVRSEQIGVRN